MPTVKYRDVIFGETDDNISADISERDAATYTVTSATVKVLNAAGTVLRNNVAATVNDTTKRASYRETYSTANGYAEGDTITAVLKVVLTASTVTYTKKLEGTFTVKAAADE